jgi:hypothetical protein
MSVSVHKFPFREVTPHRSPYEILNDLGITEPEASFREVASTRPENGLFQCSATEKRRNPFPLFVARR